MATHDNLARRITIIPVNAQETAQLRVAAYCRVSSDSSDQLNSFTAQFAYYTSLVTSNENWILVDIYADEGITGTSAEKRDDFQRLINDCRKGLIDKIYTKSISRFARNTKDCLEITRELKLLGIGVVFEEQNIDTSSISGEVLTTVFAACAQAESESISKNLRWGYQKRMESGNFITCKAPFGYRLSAGKLIIHEAEAKIVKKIFNMFLSGNNTIEIAKTISAMGVKTRDGNDIWHHTLIMYILTNEKYVGDSLLQKKYSTDTFPINKTRNKGYKAQFYVSNSHPAIIDREVFDKVQILYRSKRNIPSERVQESYDFRKSVYCDHCRKYMKRIENRGVASWICKNHYDGGSCLLTPIQERELYSAFFRFYYKMKSHGIKILSSMFDDLVLIRERQMLWSADIIEINKRISNLNSQSHKLTLLNQQGAVDADFFISKSNQLAKQLREAKREKELLLQQRENDSLRKTREIIDILKNGPDSLVSFDEELFRELVEMIIVESNDRIRFRLMNGLELSESIERTVR